VAQIGAEQQKCRACLPAQSLCVRRTPPRTVGGPQAASRIDSLDGPA